MGMICIQKIDNQYICTIQNRIFNFKFPPHPRLIGERFPMSKVAMVLLSGHSFPYSGESYPEQVRFAIINVEVERIFLNLKQRLLPYYL